MPQNIGDAQGGQEDADDAVDGEEGDGDPGEIGWTDQSLFDCEENDRDGCADGVEEAEFGGGPS